jgi:cytochrome c1
MGQRTIIAGLLPNTPPNMIRWLQAPQSVVPGNAMPNLALSDRDAADIAAFLYTLR